MKSISFAFKKSQKLNSSGFSLVEIVVAIGLTSIVILGAAALTISMFEMQRKMNIQNTILAKTRQFKGIFLNEQAFANTINAASNPNMACLRSQIICSTTATCAAVTQCSAVYVASAYSQTQDQIVLYDSSVNPAGGNLLHDGRTSSTNGYTEKGAPCIGFSSTGPGNDQCPIGYLATWYISSVGDQNGVRVTITIKFVFNPSDKHPLKKMFNTDLTKIGRYDLEVCYRYDTVINTVVNTCFQDGITLYNGASYPFYKTTTMPVCQPEFRTCSVVNGVPTLSGSAPYSTCF